MTFSQRVLTTTQDEILPKAIDNILTDNFATFRFISNGQKWRGETLKKPIKVSKNTQGGSFSGLDTHATGTVNTRVLMSYDPRGYEIPVAIPGMEKAVNETDKQVLSLIQTELESTEQDGLDDIGTMFYGDGTGNDNKDFLGLDAIADDGSSVTTIGGQSRTTYVTLKGTRTASSGTLTLEKMGTLNTAVAGGSAVRQAPTMYVSNETVWDLGEKLLASLVQANYQANGYPVVTRRSKGAINQAQFTGVQGYTSIIHRGIPWVKDEKSTAQTLWILNENYIQWYGLRSKDLKSIEMGDSNIEGVYNEAPTSDTGFQWSGFMRPFNQFGEVAHIYLLGNLVTFQPRRHGRLTGITSA